MTRHRRTALIVGDLQSGVLAGFPFARAPLGPARALVTAARAAEIPVVLVRTELRPSGVDVPEPPTRCPAVPQRPRPLPPGRRGTVIAPELRSGTADLIVTKRRTSAFAGTELNLLLRALRVERLALSGVSTSAMVAGTLYDALDRDYRVTVVGDACADPDTEVHDILLRRVFPARGCDISTSGAWIEEVSRRP